jgi:hypothetical protein
MYETSIIELSLVDGDDCRVKETVGRTLKPGTSIIRVLKMRFHIVLENIVN